jgi:predicted transcriptional regulator
VAALAAVDRALDRTPLFALRGELPVDMDEQRVQCHVCGGWYRALAPTHLSRAHGVTADEYRELVGLRPRHPLWAPDLIEAQGARLRSRIAAGAASEKHLEAR